MENSTTLLSDEIILHSDSGQSLTFKGKLFSESSYFDEESRSITRMRLYASDNGELVYSIISGRATSKHRRFYIVTIVKDQCTMSDGKQTMSLPFDMLFASVFGLCGINPARADELRPQFEETLRVANEG